MSGSRWKLIGSAVLILVLVLSPGSSSYSSGIEVGETVGKFKLTYYWIVFEKEFPGRPSVPLYTVKGKVITVVTEQFAERVSMEGTGVLRDGRVVNLHEKCKFAKHNWCFFVVDKSEAPFGYGSHAPLHPFRTLAVPDHILERGRVVYLPDFDGMPLPGDEGGFEFHDGCFVVEDTGWSLKGKHIDVFALSEDYYQRLHRQVEERLSVHVFTNSPLCPSSAASLYNPETWAQELLTFD